MNEWPKSWCHSFLERNGQVVFYAMIFFKEAYFMITATLEGKRSQSSISKLWGSVISNLEFSASTLSPSTVWEWNKIVSDTQGLKKLSPHSLCLWKDIFHQKIMLEDKEGSRSRKEESHIKEWQRSMEVKGVPRTGWKSCKEARSEQIGRHQKRFPQ